MIEILHAMIGVMLLAFGRRLFWLFVGGLGFAFGFQVAQQFLGWQSGWMVWAAALIFGAIGALLAVFFQTIAIVLGGFAAGCIIATDLSLLLGFAPAPLPVFLAGAAGAILLYVLFDWALIGLSSAAGATLVVQALNVNPSAGMLLLAVLTAAGIWFQAAWLLRSKNR